MKVAEIRSRFLNFFEKNGHTVVESSSLVPQNDPTLLFTNAGMVQFKDVFLGKESRPYKRAASVQKVVRAGGKHNDLENVGYTARHHTFFEMLGNFSFGDYFKDEAIRLAWEFVTKELKLPLDKLFVTVFETDDDAYGIWEKKIGLPKEKIFRLGEKDNFWAMGDVGPCGPCSEIFIDRGAEHGCGGADCTVGCDCDRYMEFWNLVFMQYERNAKGELTPLPRPSVDTGAGLERLASILQNVPTNYDTDVFVDIIQRTAKLVGKPYLQKSEDAFAFRVIADHSRAITFLIGDGVMPSNEGRGYVLRRIIRRAVRYGRKLGFAGPFLDKTCGFVIDQMASAYPDLTGKRAFIEKAVRAEEEQFLRTLERGLTLLDDEMAKLREGGEISGEVAFKLYDTYGFPLDLTRVIAAEKKIAVDEAGFNDAMARQREQSRQNWKGSGEEAVSGVYHKIRDELREKGRLPEFMGYRSLATESSECLAVLVERDGRVDKVDFFKAGDAGKGGSKVQVVFSATPFYPEGGGQTGDRGRVWGDGLKADVTDVLKPVPDLIVVHLDVKEGAIKVGSHYHQETNAELRQLTARNHTATHMLHWALRQLLGEHVKQAGSLVNPEMLRFDFSHFQALTEDELTQIEDMINERIWAASDVFAAEMAKDEAVAAGAIAFFGEKYGERVRVIRVGDFSTELCGGTHVKNTSDIHLFKVVSESSIAAGVRRIIAYTSKGAYNYLRDKDREIQSVKSRLKAATIEDVEAKLDKMAQTERELKRQLEAQNRQAMGGEIDALLKRVREVSGVKVLAGECSASAEGVKALREMADELKGREPKAVIVLGMKDQGKAFLLAACGKEAPPSVKANDLIKDLAPFIDGRGGGKPDMAQAGGTKPEGLAAALAKVDELVAQKV